MLVLLILLVVFFFCKLFFFSWDEILVSVFHSLAGVLLLPSH